MMIGCRSVLELKYFRTRKESRNNLLGISYNLNINIGD